MYSAIIIEPRQHKALKYVLENFLINLSTEWNIILFHGTANINFINDILTTHLHNHKERVTLVNMHIDTLSIRDYCNIFFGRFLINNRMIYDYIPTETFLVFQTDTLILNGPMINRFLEYDYVGAPWAHRPYNNQTVGNGGLSLRKKSKMLEIIKKENSKKMNVFPEDVFFSCPEIVSLNKPTHEEARFFSVEECFSRFSFGCHKTWISIPFKDEFMRLYPEVKVLMDLQS